MIYLGFRLRKLRRDLRERFNHGKQSRTTEAYLLAWIMESLSESFVVGLLSYVPLKTFKSYNIRASCKTIRS